MARILPDPAPPVKLASPTDDSERPQNARVGTVRGHAHERMPEIAR
jgi:hypothetical protein